MNIDFPAQDIYNIKNEEEKFKDFLEDRILSLMDGVTYDFLSYNIWDYSFQGYLFAFKRNLIRATNSLSFDNFIMFTVLIIILNRFVIVTS